MKELANLSRIVMSRGLRNLPLLDLNGPNLTKEKQLIDSLLRNASLTQNQLVREIYGATTPANVEAFWQLRARLQGKLLNHLYFLDHNDPRHPVGRRQKMSVLQMLHQANILLEEGEYVLAEQRLRRCLLMAERDDFLHYAVLAARDLRNLYANQRKPTKYRALTQVYRTLNQRLAAENEAEDLYIEVRNSIAGTIKTRQALLPQLSEYVARLEALHEQTNTFNTATYLYRTRLTQHEMLGKFAEILRITTETEEQFQSGALNTRRFDRRYNHFMMVYAYLRLRRPGEGLELAAKFLLDFHPSSNNWFSFQENHLLLALHAGHYDLARQVQQAVIGNPFYQRQRTAAHERWDLYGAYLDFLLPAGTGVRSKQVAQWALQLPDFNRDKRGYHVAILVLQLLYYLRLQHLDEVMARLERLRKYQQLHLRDQNTLRSRLFLRLLALLQEKDFAPQACAESGLNLLVKLQEAPQPGEAYAQIEVVPYEELWHLTLQLLRRV